MEKYYGEIRGSSSRYKCTIRRDHWFASLPVAAKVRTPKSPTDVRTPCKSAYRLTAYAIRFHNQLAPDNAGRALKEQNRSELLGSARSSLESIITCRTHNTQTGDQGTYARNPVKKRLNFDYVDKISKKKKKDELQAFT
ncbi:hypothetical protein QTP88_002795 [Uroleucon formosanum]